MKMLAVVNVSKYAENGFSIRLEQLENRNYLACLENYKIVGEVEIDLEPHYAWIAERAEGITKEMMEEAQERYELSIREIKEFESKFLLLGAPPINEDPIY